MRTNLVDSLIVGLAIGGVVLLARWLHGTPLLELSAILLGGLFVTILHILLTGRRAAQPAPAPPEPAEPLPEQAPLHSPRMEWGADGGPSPARRASEPEETEDDSRPARPNGAADRYEEEKDGIIPSG
jgi:hypothetical protein